MGMGGRFNGQVLRMPASRTGLYDYELPGSGVAGAFLDTNAVTGLIYNST